MRLPLLVLVSALCGCVGDVQPGDEHPVAAGGGASGGGAGGGSSGGGSATGGGGVDAGLPANAVTVTVQQNHGGYVSSRATAISTYGGLGAVGQYNANGLTFGDGDADWCSGTDLSGPPRYDEVMLLRFEDLPVPKGATVIAASLSVWAYSQEPQVHLSGRYLSVSWPTVSCAGCGAAIGWRYRDGESTPWGALGAAGEGSDVIAGKSFRLPDTGAMPNGWAPGAPVTATLDPQVVQRWVDGTANHGVRLVTANAGIHASIVPPQRSGSDAYKPLLSITYLP